MKELKRLQILSQNCYNRVIIIIQYNSCVNDASTASNNMMLKSVTQIHRGLFN